MIKRLNTHYTLTQKDIDKINKIAEETGLKPSRVLSKIISEYKEFDADLLMETLNKIVKRNNHMSKQVDILMGIVNSICIKNTLVAKDFVGLDEFTGEFFKTAENEVEKNIKRYQVKKYSTK